MSRRGPSRSASDECEDPGRSDDQDRNRWEIPDMTHEPRLQRRAALPYVAVPCHVTEQGVAAAVDTAFPELFRWLAERGVEPAGP